jgi:hypothetical protein
MTAMQVVDQAVVDAIAEQVWESLLRAPALPWRGESPAMDGDIVDAQITLDGGAWHGLVRLVCLAATAEQMAVAMLDAHDETLTQEDVFDAVGEVVNVVGGNVKGVLSGSVALGLPVVGPVREGSLGIPVCGSVLDWHGSPVAVEVFETP